MPFSQNAVTTPNLPGIVPSALYAQTANAASPPPAQLDRALVGGSGGNGAGYGGWGGSSGSPPAITGGGGGGGGAGATNSGTNGSNFNPINVFLPQISPNSFAPGGAGGNPGGGAGGRGGLVGGFGTPPLARANPGSAGTASRGGGGGGGGGLIAPGSGQDFDVGGAGGGGRGNAGNAGNAGNPGNSGNPGSNATHNCVPVIPGCSYPIVVGGPSGGSVVINWNPQ